MWKMVFINAVVVGHWCAAHPETLMTEPTGARMKQPATKAPTVGASLSALMDVRTNPRASIMSTYWGPCSKMEPSSSEIKMEIPAIQGLQLEPHGQEMIAQST